MTINTRILAPLWSGLTGLLLCSPIAGSGAVPNFDLVGFATLDGFSSNGTYRAGGTTGGAAGGYVQVWTATNLYNYLQRSNTMALMVEVMTNIDMGVPGLTGGVIQPTNSPFLVGKIDISSDKTVFSKNGSTLSHGILRVNGTRNVIIRNLKFRDLWEYDPTGGYKYYDWDYVKIEGGHHVWVDHCDFQTAYDGMIDTKNAGDFVTVSWNVFRDHKKCHLTGANDTDYGDRTHLNMTFHHNYYTNVDERIPRMRFGNAHVFNLYCERLTGKGIESCCEAASLIENVYFTNNNGGTPLVLSNSSILLGSAWVTNSVGITTTLNDSSFSFNNPFVTSQPPYAYTNALNAVTNVPFMVKTYAGVGKVNPSIDTPPQSQTITQGQNATFSVVAIGATPMSYRWYFNTNTPLPNATNAILTITNAQLTDAGTYSVVVTNFFGAVTSSIATLTVNSAGVAPSITTQPTNQLVVVGENATFSVVATGTPDPIYQWYFNTNTPLTDATNATLILTNAQTGDAGAYSVVVSNSAGSITSSNALLAVNRPPVPGAWTTATGQAIPVAIALADLVAVASDPDGDGLSVTGVSSPTANGGTVTLGGSSITYSPGALFVGPDLASYTLTDARGASAVGTVSVTVISSTAITLNLTAPPVLSNGVFRASYSGVPLLTYSIDRATDLPGPWTLGYTNLTADTNGLFELIDTDGTPATQRFYRTHYP
jgi:pectate lyase